MFDAVYLIFVVLVSLLQYLVFLRHLFFGSWLFLSSNWLGMGSREFCNVRDVWLFNYSRLLLWFWNLFCVFFYLVLDIQLCMLSFLAVICFLAFEHHLVLLSDLLGNLLASHRFLLGSLPFVRADIRTRSTTQLLLRRFLQLWILLEMEKVLVPHRACITDRFVVLLLMTISNFIGFLLLYWPR